MGLERELGGTMEGEQAGVKTEEKERPVGSAGQYAGGRGVQRVRSMDRFSLLSPRVSNL